MMKVNSISSSSSSTSSRSSISSSHCSSSSSSSSSYSDSGGNSGSSSSNSNADAVVVVVATKRYGPRETGNEESLGIYRHWRAGRAAAAAIIKRIINIRMGIDGSSIGGIGSSNCLLLLTTATFYLMVLFAHRSIAKGKSLRCYADTVIKLLVCGQKNVIGCEGKPYGITEETLSCSTANDCLTL
ncbi:unnamed protein product [Thelazia callipaeda]|uniref:Wsv206 n=1 Tax=Thelazia callipaeda TaxID=103827 RepID=A0A0N5CW44_THECL|nr:unnamed protein product [Thelazia callipaeda]